MLSLLVVLRNIITYNVAVHNRSGARIWKEGGTVMPNQYGGGPSQEARRAERALGESLNVWLQRRYETDRCTIYVIADELAKVGAEIDPATVTRWLRAAGIVVRPRGRQMGRA